jgi:hypothetical protein
VSFHLITRNLKFKVLKDAPLDLPERPTDHALAAVNFSTFKQLLFFLFSSSQMRNQKSLQKRNRTKKDSGTATRELLNIRR